MIEKSTCFQYPLECPLAIPKVSFQLSAFPNIPTVAALLDTTTLRTSNLYVIVCV